MVDLPEPDSPTRPKVSPSCTAKLTLFDACTYSRRLSNSESLVTKRRLTFSTFNSGPVYLR
ncbi:Uncharacterised protein [Vibrio cholerae]|nr:Uncharacterised protein [Vibrio cholerae]